MEKEHFTVGYWNTRAIGEPVRLMLEHCVGTNWTDKRYQVGAPPSYDKSEWSDVKEHLNLSFPNLPYLQIEKTNSTGTTTSTLQLTQMHSIMRHLGERFGMLGDTKEERILVDMVMESLRDWFYAWCDVTYCNAPWLDNQESDVHVEGEEQCLKTSDKFQRLRENYEANILPRHIARYEKLLTTSDSDENDGRRWIAGTKSMTVADIILFEYVDQHLIFGSPLSDVMLRHRAMVLEDPSIARYRSSDRFRVEPLHNRYSHFHQGWEGVPDTKV